MKRGIGALLLSAVACCGCAELPFQVTTGPIGSAAVGASSGTASGLPSAAHDLTDAQITSTLLHLVDNESSEKVNLTGVQPGTPLNDILSLGSPIGYQLRNRYLAIGIPLSEALARDSDPDIHAQLVQLARWNGDGEVRSAGLVTLAKFQDLSDLPVFEEAMINLDAGVRFGAIEALQAWGHPDKATPILKYVAQKDPEVLLRTLAAAALARMGDSLGLTALRSGLDDGSWLVRAMSARYLGEMGTGDDYDLLVSRLGRETSYDFVLAEYCVAALKLFPKKKA